MPLSFQQLTTPVSEDELTETILGWASDLGFKVTAWQTGSVGLTIVRFIARLGSDFTNTVSEHAKGGLLGKAAGDLLTHLARYNYKTERNAATNTQGVMLLASSAAAPVHTWGAGELVISDLESGDGANTFRVLDAGTINPGTSLIVAVEAEIAGAQANIANDSDLYLWTPLVGVTATNPAASGSTTWITAAGADAELDDRLTVRARGQLDRKSYSNIEGAYVAWVLEALPAVTRVRVVTAPDGIVIIYGATSTGGLTALQESTIEDYINGVSDGVGRRPINDTVTVSSATVIVTPALDVAAYVDGSFAADASERAQLALTEFLGSLPIGGKRIGVGVTGYVLIADLYKTLMALEGFENVTLSLTSDLLLNPNEIYSPAITISVVVL